MQHASSYVPIKQLFKTAGVLKQPGCQIIIHCRCLDLEERKIRLKTFQHERHPISKGGRVVLASQQMDSFVHRKGHGKATLTMFWQHHSCAQGLAAARVGAFSPEFSFCVLRIHCLPHVGFSHCGFRDAASRCGS